MRALNNKPIRIMDFRGTYKGGGGPDKTILNSAAQHDPSRVDVLVTYLRDPTDEAFEIHLKAKELDVQYIDVPDRTILDLRCLKLLHALIQEHQITLLHAHDDKTLLYACLLKCFNPSLRMMCTCHSHSCYKREDFSGLLSYCRFLVRERIQVFLMNRFNKPILTISKNTKTRLSGSGVKYEDIEVLYNGINIDEWGASKGTAVLKKEFNLPENSLIVGTVARITYDKDLQTFYETARLVAKKVKDVLFVIVGDGYGNELAKSKAEVEGLGLHHLVQFTGHRNDLLDIYKSFDLFLMTSLTEGMPNTVLEAMAMEVPVVSTAVGGVPELVVDGETGFLSEKGDPPGLSKQVIRLLKNDKLRGDFAARGRERLEALFSFSSRVIKMEAYYEAFSTINAVKAQ